MIYVILYSMLVRPTGSVSDVFYSASLDKREAEKLYSLLLLTKQCYEKTLWQIDSKGIRTKIESETYYDEHLGRNK